MFLNVNIQQLELSELNLFNLKIPWFRFTYIKANIKIHTFCIKKQVLLVFQKLK